MKKTLFIILFTTILAIGILASMYIVGYTAFLHILLILDGFILGWYLGELKKYRT